MIKIAHPLLENDEIAAVTAVLSSGILVNGKETKKLEEEVARSVGRKYCIALSSGTAALHCALHSLDMGNDAEVLTSPFSFIATANAIIFCGAKPVFVDIEEESCNLNAQLIEERITSKTKAILSVDLFGQACAYNHIEAIAKKQNLMLVTDSCQSFGAMHRKKYVGSFGTVGVFSLYATKNITCGEGGIVVTDDENIARKIKIFSNQGQEIGKKYHYVGPGHNYRMTEMQAAIALAQMKKLSLINEKRKANAKILSMALSGCKKIKLPLEKEENTHIFHQYTIRVNAEIRDHLVSFLQEKNIEAAVFYPKPLHFYPHIAQLGYKSGDFPVAEKIAQEVVSIPVHPGVSENDLLYIAKCVREFYEKN